MISIKSVDKEEDLCVSEKTSIIIPDLELLKVGEAITAWRKNGAARKVATL